MRRRILWAVCLAACAVAWYAGAAPALAVGISLLVLPPLSWLALPAASKQLRPVISAPLTAEKGAAISVCVTVEQRSIWPTGPVSWVLRARNELTGEETAIPVTGFVSPRGRACWQIPMTARHCGYLRLQVSSLRVYDLFGLLPRPTKLGAKEAVTVLPEMAELSLSVTVPPAAQEDRLDYAPDRPGYDESEVFQLREYRPGDSLRAVHWKLSAKRQELVLKEPSLPVMRSILVFLDKNTGSPTPDGLDQLADQAASLCKTLCEAGLAFCLSWSEDGRPVGEQVENLDELAGCLPRMLRKGGDGSECTRQALGEYGRIYCVAWEKPADLADFTEIPTAAHIWTNEGVLP